MIQRVVEVYEVRVSLGRPGGITFSALFDGDPGIQDVVAAIQYKRKTARVFSLAPPELFIEVVKRLGVPMPNHAHYDKDGSFVHVVGIDEFPCMSGPSRPKRNPLEYGPIESCPLCNVSPEHRIHGVHGLILFHVCPGVPGEEWYPTLQSWVERNEKLRERYKR